MSRDHKKELLTVLKAYAPDQDSKDMCDAIVVDAVRLLIVGPDLDGLLSGIIHAGISYGNWPWVTRK